MNRYTTSYLRKCWILASILAANSFPATAQSSGVEPYTFLTKYIGCSKSDLSSLKRGEPLAKILQTANPGEIAVFGAIRVHVPAEFFLQKYRDITNFKKSKEVLEIGKFSEPPRLQDLQPLTLDSSETNSLKDCAVGACSMKLTVEMIQRLHKEVDWSTPASNQLTVQVFRQMLFDYVANYRAKGNGALAVYADKNPPVRLESQFLSLLKASPYLSAYVPEFENYLANYPNARLASGEDFIYESKEQFGAKPVVSVTHVTIYRVPGSASIVIGAKQIFADHYFTASLGLAAFVHVPESGAQDDGYLMYLNRSRVDLLGGFLNFLKRWVLNRRLRQGVEDNLRLAKKRLESAYSY